MDKLRFGTAIFMAAICGGVVSNSLQPLISAESRVVDAEQFRIVDASGKVRGMFGLKQGKVQLALYGEKDEVLVDLLPDTRALAAGGSLKPASAAQPSAAPPSVQKRHAEVVVADGNVFEIRGAKAYVGPSTGHWIQRNIDGGRYIMLEDNSLWDTGVDRVSAMLWLPISNVVVRETSAQGVLLYQLINTDDEETAYATFVGFATEVR